MRKNEDKLIHKIGRGVVTGVMTTALVAAPPVTMLISQTVAVADEVTPAEQATVTDITAGGTIDKDGSYKLANDINSTITVTAKSATIDLNGHDINVTTGDAIVNRGGLTITGTGNVTTSAADSAAIANVPNATIAVNGGTYSSTSWYVIKNLGSMTLDSATTVKGTTGNASSVIANGWYGATDTVAGNNISAQADKASLTITNGTFTSGDKSSSVVKNDDYGTLIIDGGTFDSTANSNTSDSATLINWNVATINGGSFKGTNYSITNGSLNDTSDKGELTIKGGMFDTTSKSGVFGTNGGAQDSKGEVTIAGGTFNKEVTNTGKPYDVKVSGGTFANDVTDLTTDDASVATVNAGDTTTYAVGQDAIGAAAKDAANTVTITRAPQGLTLPPETKAEVKNETNNIVKVGDTVIEKGKSTNDYAKTDIAKATVSPIADQTETGNAIRPSVTVKDGDTTLAEGTDYYLTYTDNIKPGQAKIAITGIGNYSGTKTVNFNIKAAPVTPEATTVPMYRLYNKWTGEHLFTLDQHEYDNLGSLGWTKEGISWNAPKTAKTPVYRLYNPYSGDHLYTVDKAEYDKLGKTGWQQENIAFYSADKDAEGAQAIYRLFNPYETVGTHLYTTDKAEYDKLQPLGWKGEDIAFYAISTSGK